LIFGFVSAQSQAAAGMLLGQSLAKKPEILAPHGYTISSNALSEICQRPGWNAIPAVRNGQVHEIKSAHILQPGPSLLKGFGQLRQIINNERADLVWSFSKMGSFGKNAILISMPIRHLHR
jgi:iron complex transport system substrate-binding protein